MVRCHYTPVRMAKIQNSDTKCGKGCGATGTRIHCWWECKMVQPLGKTVWQLLTELNKLLPWPRAPLYFPKGAANVCPTKSRTWMFTAALFMITKTWKQLRCELTFWTEFHCWRSFIRQFRDRLKTPLVFLSLLPTNCLLTLTAHTCICKRGQRHKREVTLGSFCCICDSGERIGHRKGIQWLKLNLGIIGGSQPASQPAAIYRIQPGQPFKRKLAEKDNTLHKRLTRRTRTQCLNGYLRGAQRQTNKQKINGVFMFSC